MVSLYSNIYLYSTYNSFLVINVIRERLYAHPVHCEKLMTGKFRTFTMEEQTPLILSYSESSFKLSEFLTLKPGPAKDMSAPREGKLIGASGWIINWCLGKANDWASLHTDIV